MSSEVLTSSSHNPHHQHHHNHHHHHHPHHQSRRMEKLSRSQTLDRNNQNEKSSKAADPGDKVLKCAKHTASHPQTQHKSPGRGQGQTPPKLTTSSTPVSRRSHHSDCRKLSRSHSASTSTTTSTFPHGGPVVITQYRERGDALVTEAENKLSRSLFRSGDVAGALDCFQRAVAQYKLAGHWKLAGETLSRMGDIYRKQADHAGAGRLYGEAGNCYRKCSATAAVASYHKSAEQYLELGKFGIPAKHHEAIALIYSKEVHPLDNSLVLHHLSLAAHYYYNDNRNAARNKCRLELARVHARMENYQEALQIYEELGYNALESRLLKYSADEYFFRAGLCHLAIDCLNCQIALQKYVEYYPAFEVSREHKFLKSLCSELEQENDEGFEEIVRKNKTLVGLDPWYSKIVNKIRQDIPGELNSLR